MTTPDPSRPQKRAARRGWLRRAGVIAAIAAPTGVLALWVAVNRVEWLGPYVADTLRAVVGAQAVADLEDFAYSVQDRFNRFWRKDERPKAYWEVPEKPQVAAPASEAAKPPEPQKAEEKLPPFRPRDVGPAHDGWSAPGDGIWVPIADAAHPDREPYMMKTLLHPDRSRSWAEVFVVAIDLRRVRIHLVPGKQEPVATEKGALDVPRPGVIPEKHRDLALAAFNGGFKTEHGGYGMQVGALTYVAPVAGVCAVAGYPDGDIRVARWENLADSRDRMTFWRQTPNCMIEDGKLHPRLSSESLAKKWGATLDGETVIRRSAVGVGEGPILYVSISNHTTAQAIAEGVRHAGATTVAQLDVNFSYPKFVTFEPKKDVAEGEAPRKIAVPLADGFEFSEDEYIRKTARRDFFYVMPADEDDRTAQNGD